MDSDADPGFLSQVPDPVFHPDPRSRILDSESRMQQKQKEEREEKKLVCLTFFRSHKFHEIKIIYFFEQV